MLTFRTFKYKRHLPASLQLIMPTVYICTRQLNRRRISAKAENFNHWRGRRAKDAGFYAPNYVIFETHTVGSDDNGGTAELRDGSRIICRLGV